ncbi:MAG: radical SAM protein [Candidatus Ozemobacteraceae bacterium]
MSENASQRLLLTSVCGPFGVDDGFSTRENPCELFQNQVTRMQGVFSIRSHIRSFGLEFLAANLEVPATVLDFPDENRFLRELITGRYTHVGISFIVPNVDKARNQCRLVREHAPGVKIIVGGHGTRIPGVKELLGCDYVCCGEGIRWLRAFFGEDPSRPIRHPAIPVEYHRRLLGLPLVNRKAVLVPGVGCAQHCEFCCTSHFFDGYTALIPDADQLFEIMCSLSDTLRTNEFYVMDENFLGDEARVHRLIELMHRHQRYFVLDVFSTLRDLSRYDPLTLVKLGLEFAWVGIESRRPLFAKVAGIDAAAVMEKLRRHGVSLLASTILFLDHHDEKSLWDDVEFTIGLSPDYIQFMELGPFPGTPLYERMVKAGRIRHREYRYWHGQERIWFDHPRFSADDSKRILDEAFRREFQALGPSMLRNAETRLLAVETGRVWTDPFLKARHAIHVKYARQVRPILPALWLLSPTPDLRAKARRVIDRYEQVLGPLTAFEKLQGCLLTLSGRMEQRRLLKGREVSQPPTVITRYRQ